MKLIEKDGKVVLIDDNGNEVNPQDPIAFDYVTDTYNILVKEMHRLEQTAKSIGFKSIDQINNVTYPDVETMENYMITQEKSIKDIYYNPTLQMDKDYYTYIQKESDLVRKYISENNIDYGTVDENGFIVKKKQER